MCQWLTAYHFKQKLVKSCSFLKIDWSYLIEVNVDCTNVSFWEIQIENILSTKVEYNRIFIDALNTEDLLADDNSFAIQTNCSEFYE